jgi:AcrR family transcriptional regulator
MTGQSPRERRHERTRDAILMAALDIVSKGGIEALSMREVARRIDYSPAGLYEYFGSKEEMVAALVNEGYRRFADHLRQVPADLPPYERLIALGVAYLDFARSHPQYYLVMFTGLSEWWVEGKPVIDERGAYQMLVDTVKDGVSQGVFKSKEDTGPDEMTYACWALVHGMAMLQLNQLKGTQDAIRQADREVLCLLADGMMQAK